jgi:hypothetical protein
MAKIGPAVICLFEFIYHISFTDISLSCNPGGITSTSIVNKFKDQGKGLY